METKEPRKAPTSALSYLRALTRSEQNRPKNDGAESAGSVALEIPRGGDLPARSDAARRWLSGGTAAATLQADSVSANPLAELHKRAMQGAANTPSWRGDVDIEVDDNSNTPLTFSDVASGYNEMGSALERGVDPTTVAVIAMAVTQSLLHQGSRSLLLGEDGDSRGAETMRPLFDEIRRSVETGEPIRNTPEVNKAINFLEVNLQSLGDNSRTKDDDESTPRQPRAATTGGGVGTGGNGSGGSTTALDPARGGESVGNPQQLISSTAGSSGTGSASRPTAFGGDGDIIALVMAALRDAYKDSVEDLRNFKDKLEALNAQKAQIRSQLSMARGFGASDSPIGKNLEDKLNTVGDDSQLAAFDLQTAMQRMQQILTTMTDISKAAHDTAMSVIRKIGG